MSERRMTAYYYDFALTGVPSIDKIFGAVACAGKAFHHTEDWNDECGPYDDHTGASPVEWIQNAGNEAAAEIERLRAALEEIAKPTYGTEWHMSGEERAEILGRHLFNKQAIARAALRGTDDAGGAR